MGRQYLIMDRLGSKLQSKTAQTVCTHLHIPTPIRRHQRHTHPEQQLCFHNDNIKTYRIPKNGPPIPSCDRLGSELQLHIPTPIRRHQRHAHPEQQLCFHNARHTKFRKMGRQYLIVDRLGSKLQSKTA